MPRPRWACSCAPGTRPLPHGDLKEPLSLCIASIGRQQAAVRVSAIGCQVLCKNRDFVFQCKPDAPRGVASWSPALTQSRWGRGAPAQEGRGGPRCPGRLRRKALGEFEAMGSTVSWRPGQTIKPDPVAKRKPQCGDEMGSAWRPYLAGTRPGVRSPAALKKGQKKQCNRWICRLIVARSQNFSQNWTEPQALTLAASPALCICFISFF